MRSDWLAWNPPAHSEANKRRPAIIVSNDNANASAARLGRGVVTVGPVTGMAQIDDALRLHLQL